MAALVCRCDSDRAPPDGSMLSRAPISGATLFDSKLKAYVRVYSSPATPAAREVLVKSIVVEGKQSFSFCLGETLVLPMLQGSSHRFGLHLQREGT